MSGRTPPAKPLTWGFATGAVTALARVASQWPRMTTWGATGREVTAPMPGDEIVAQARYRSTHAIDIAAPAVGVWPWLVQMGQGRGGLYSYDRIENLLGLDIHSADRIEPTLQNLAVGDVVRLVPEGTVPPLQFVVARLDPPHVLVLGPEGDLRSAVAARLPFPVWTFLLDPVGDAACRLVVRFQADYDPSPLNRLVYGVVLAPIHLVMERRMLIGIKRLAERALRR